MLILEADFLKYCPANGHKSPLAGQFEVFGIVTDTGVRYNEF